jgi:hypothetical protein
MEAVDNLGTYYLLPTSEGMTCGTGLLICGVYDNLASELN